MSVLSPNSTTRLSGKTHAIAAAYAPRPSVPSTRPMSAKSRNESSAPPRLLTSRISVLRGRRAVERGSGGVSVGAPNGSVLFELVARCHRHIFHRNPVGFRVGQAQNVVHG